MVNLTYLHINTVPNVTIGAGEIGSLVNLTTLYLRASANIALQTVFGLKLTSVTYWNSLLTADVDAVLWGLYQMTATPRTGVAGTINVATTNQAPSGVYQPCAACPVTVATPGKEVAWELKLDSCGVGFNKWTAVITS
jgi:hypothetical protein